MLCVECMNNDIKTLFSKYESDYIKLTICPKCGKVSDKYIEYDNVILFIDILLLKPQAYRHLAYNVTETEITNSWKDSGAYSNMRQFSSRYSKIIKTLTIVILFEVYLKWTNEERLSKHSVLMEYVLRQDTYLKYAFFVSKSVIEESSLLFFILALLRFACKWGLTENTNLDSSAQLGYYNSVLLVTVLVAGSIKLFPILMLIWPYDKTSVPLSVIDFISYLNIVEAIRVVTNFSLKNIIFIMIMAVLSQLVISSLIMNFTLSCFSAFTFKDLLCIEIIDYVDTISRHGQLVIQMIKLFPDY